MSNLSVSLNAINDVRDLGVPCLDAALWACETVHRAAKCTHDYGNRRYGDLIFQVEGDSIKRVRLRREAALCYDCLGTQTVRQFDPCGYCDGAGCARCDRLGGEQILIDCPTCQPRKNM